MLYNSSTYRNNLIGVMVFKMLLKLTSLKPTWRVIEFIITILKIEVRTSYLKKQSHAENNENW